MNIDQVIGYTILIAAGIISAIWVIAFLTIIPKIINYRNENLTKKENMQKHVNTNLYTKEK